MYSYFIDLRQSRALKLKTKAEFAKPVQTNIKNIKNTKNMGKVSTFLAVMLCLKPLKPINSHIKPIIHQLNF